MTVVLDGRSLTPEDVVRVARRGEDVTLAPAAVAAMRRAREIAESVIDTDGEAYGLTTGVGVHKRSRISDGDHDRLLVRQHLIGQGASAPRDVGRATALVLANSLARGTTAARPEVAGTVLEALRNDRVPPLRILGSVGQSDLSAMADLAAGLLDELELARGEAISLLNQNAFSTGWASLAVTDALVLLRSLDCAGALSLEALGGAPAALDPALADARPYPGVRVALERINGLLDGSERVPRNLQDPLVFRTLPFLHGAARDAFAFVAGQLAIELNAVQSNPLVLPDGRVLSVGTFEIAPLATALDLARLALGPLVTASAERALKLLQAPLTGLRAGLQAEDGLAESALSEIGIAVQSIAAEARLLAQPVSLELVSTTQAEGIEDRTTMAPLAARRLAEMVELTARVAAVELLVAGQACELRAHRLGRGTAVVLARVRERVAFVGPGDDLPDLEPLVAVVCTGELDG